MRPGACLLLGLLAACAGPGAPSGEEPASRPAEIELRFSGNLALPQSALEARAPTLFAALRRGKTTRAQLADAAWEVEEAYRARGFPDVRVETETSGAPPDQVLFRIQEGPRITLGRVEVEGARALPEQALADLLETPRVRYLGLELGTGLFSRAALQAWRAEVLEAYREAGYLQVQAADPDVSRSPERGQADVRLALAEGPLYRIGAIEILGDREALSPMTLHRVLALQGRPAAPSRVVQIRNRLQADLAASGRLAARVRVAQRREDAQARVDISCEVHAGPQTRIERVDLVGLERTRPGLVHGKLGLGPGDILSRNRLEEGLATLYRTGLFTRVDQHIELGDAGESARLELAFEEAPAQELWLLAGGGSYEGPRLGAGYSHRNLFGTGRILASQANVSYRILRAGASITDPDFLLPDQALTLSGQAFRHRRPAFTETSLGTEVSLSRPLARRLRLRTAWSYTREEVRDAPEELRQADPEIQVGALQAQLAYDRRNALLAPTRGTLLRGTVDLAARFLGGDTAFTRLQYEAIHLLYVGAGTVLAGRWETGVIYPWAGTSVIPLPERFFNGGETTVRSFRQDRLGPENTRGTPIGGEFANTLGVELRVPLSGGLQGALFYDAGNVGLEAAGWTLNRLRQGLGLGLRYLLPVGPVRCDLAWNPDQRPDDEALVLHFSIGFPF